MMASPTMPTSAAMAWAVIKWSPVIMMTLIPASFWQTAIASLTPGFGGSIMAWRPMKMRSFSSEPLATDFSFLYAKAKTLKASLARVSFCSRIFFL